MDGIGAYQEREFSASRNPTIDILELGRKKHHIPVLLEIDITESRKRLVVFDDVDVSVLVERVVNRQAGQTETLPMPYVVRKANEKSVQAIHTEIRAAQAAPVTKGEVQIDSTRQAFATRLFARLPRFLRNLIVWRPLLNNPLRTKKTMGTVVVTSIGNIGKSNDSSSGWAIPTGIHALVVAVGSIARKPGVIGDAIEIREYLSMTVLFDHDVVDGAPVARFVQRLKELLETCYGLDEAFESATPALMEVKELFR